ncbi:MAG: hypothetical protein AVDCRST_MAG30-768, partial [uncultured Solirubrobacteraceae bacterium]
EHDRSPPRAKDHARGGPRGEGLAARAVLRPRLRLRAHPGHGVHGRRSDLRGDGPRPAHPGARLVGVVGLHVADEHRRPRADAPAARDVRGDGGDARRGARDPRGVRRRRRDLGPRVHRRAGAARGAVLGRRGRRRGARAQRPLPDGLDRPRRRAHPPRRPRLRRLGPHAAVGSRGPPGLRDRDLPVGLGELARARRALLRALRPRDDHRVRRVDRRDRDRGGRPRARDPGDRLRARGRGRRLPALVGVLRPLRAGRRARVPRGGGRRAGAHGPRLLRAAPPPDDRRRRPLRARRQEGARAPRRPAQGDAGGRADRRPRPLRARPGRLP